MSSKGGRQFQSYPYPRMRHATRDVLRAAGRKPMIHSLVEIDVTDARRTLREIRAAQSEAVDTVGVYRGMRLFLLIPSFFRLLLFRLLDRMPRLMKERVGTIMVTSVGMSGAGAGWGVPVASHTLNVAIGSVVQRVERRGQEMVERDKLCLTISFDHDIVDGGPAARYVRRLRQIIESAALLEE